MRGSGTHPIRTNRPEEDFVEQSSDDIWAACGAAVRDALAQAGAAAEQVAGIGFDATCSLVALDAHDRPVTVSPSGDDAWNVVVWMDHRATAQAARINETRHEVLRYVGGVVSPEMQTPKLLWLKEKLPATGARGALPRSARLPRRTARRASTCARSAPPCASGRTSGTTGAAGSANRATVSATSSIAWSVYTASASGGWLRAARRCSTRGAW